MKMGIMPYPYGTDASSWKNKVKGIRETFPADAAPGDRWLLSPSEVEAWHATNITTGRIYSAVAHAGAILLLGNGVIYSFDPVTFHADSIATVSGVTFYHGISHNGILALATNKGIYHWRPTDAAPKPTNKTTGTFTTPPVLFQGKAFFGDTSTATYPATCPAFYDFVTTTVTTLDKAAVNVTGQKVLWPWTDGTGYPALVAAWLVKDDILWGGSGAGIFRIDGSTTGGKINIHIPRLTSTRYTEQGITTGFNIRGLCEFQGRIIGAGAWARVIVDEENDTQDDQTDYPDAHPDYRSATSSTYAGQMLLMDGGGDMRAVVKLADLDDRWKTTLRTLDATGDVTGYAVTESGVFLGITGSDAGIFHFDGSTLSKLTTPGLLNRY